MRILLVTGIFPPDHGGPASYVPMIASELKARNHEIVAIVTLSDLVDGNGYDFPVIRLRRAMWRPLRIVKTIWTIMRHSRRADVTYLNGLALEGIIATGLMNRRPVVMKVVGDLIWERARNARATQLDLDEFQRAKLPPRWRMLRWLQGLYTGLAESVIVPSAYLGAIVRGWGVDPAKIRVIHNAVALPAPGPIAPRYDLITVARLVPWKGIADLIEVAGSNGWSLRIVGDGPLMPELTRQAAASGANVSFAGHVRPDRICEELRSAHLFVLNSSYEGLPHIVLEAKAAGVPVIATAAGGTGEIMHHDVDGWVVPVGSRESLAHAIRHLLSHADARARLAEQGRRQVVAEHSVRKLIDDTEAALAGA
jgi:glycosyltransferase involved in cell wall biosynthesis